MRASHYITALVTGCLPAAHAAMPEQEAYQRLHSALGEEVSLLKQITDETTAQSTVEPLSRAIHELAALNDEVDENELWRYLDNTPGIKAPLIRLIEDMLMEFQRIEQAHFFNCEELKTLLSPMLNPAS